MNILKLASGFLAVSLFLILGSNCDNSESRTIDTEVTEELDGDIEVKKTKVTEDQETGERKVIEEETDIDSEGNVTEKEVEVKE